MKKRGFNKWKIAGGVAGAAVLVSIIGFTAAKYKDNNYQSDQYAGIRDKRENQIIFPGQDVPADGGDSSDSELWEQNDESQRDLNADNKGTASMLFQTKKVAGSDEADQETETDQTDKNGTDTVYSSKKDNKSNGDRTVVDNSGNGDKTPGPGGSDDNSGGKTDKPGRGDKTDDDSKPSKPDNSGKDDSGKKDDNSGDDDTDDNKGKDDGDKTDDDKPGTPDFPINDVDTTVPKLPKDDVIISADPYPGDDNIDVKDDDEYKRYSLAIIGIQDDEDKINNLYTGEYLNDQRVLCSVLVYVCVDGVPKYRLTQLNNNFRIGAYPQQVKTDSVDLTFYYRPNEKYSWISATYTSKVMYSAKLMLQDWNEGEYAVQYLVPKDNNKVLMFQYYTDMVESAGEDVDDIFLGWSEEKNGQSVGPFYNVEGNGAKILYPVAYSKTLTNSTVSWQGYGLEMDNSYYYKKLQTLKEYVGTDSLLDIQEGVQAVDLPVDIDWDTWDIIMPTFDKVKVPASMVLLGGTYGDNSQANSYSFQVNGEYEVDEDNMVYSSHDGMLLSKDGTVIYDIPRNMQDITVPATVQHINFAFLNNISEVHISSSKPSAIDFSYLYNAKIYVPSASYVRYLAAWGNNPGGNGNVLISDDGAEQSFVEDDQAIYTEDRKTLVSVKSSVDGVYIVPAGVERIASDALENCGQLELVILPESITTLDKNSLSVNAPAKIVFLGNSAPSVDADTFDAATILQIRKTAETEYSRAWDGIISDLDSRTCYREYTFVPGGEDGFTYLDEEECDDDVDGAILIQAASAITTFDENSVPGVVWKSIAPKAFVNCSKLYIAELPATVKTVGRNAFAGCSALQGVVAYSEDTMTVGEGGFDDTWNLRFLAFDALYLDCYYYTGSAAVYASCNGSGYDSADRFSPYYELDDVNGGRLLYGIAADEYGDPIDASFVLGATMGVSGELKLRDNAREIAGDVFKNCASEFTLEGMDHIIAIGANAFNNSGISGKIEITGSYEYVGDYAFSGCSNITEVEIDGSGLDKNLYIRPFGSNVFSWCVGIERLTITGGGNYDLCESAFMGCTSLATVDIDEDSGLREIMYGALSMTAISYIKLPKGLDGIGYGAFESCSNLTQVVLTGTKVPELFVYAPGMQFTFGSTLGDEGWLSIPEGMEQDYIDLWKYYMIGRTPDDAPFLTDEELLESENVVRKLLGMDPVSSDADSQAGKVENDSVATASDAKKEEKATESMEGER